MEWSLKAKNDARNAAETEGLHQAQYNALPEELKYKGDSSVEELLKKELRGEPVTEAERAYIAIYGNQNDIYHVECQKRKQELEQEFSAYLESVGLSGKEFSIHLKTGGKAGVSGLDEAQKEQVEDLTMERKVTGWYIYSENIVGLPSVIASSLNSADSTDKYYDNKQMINSILNYKQKHGEIPQYHMDFQWNGRELE